MEYLTDFADQGVMLPVAAVVAAGLAAFRWWRGLLAWAIAIPGVLGTVALLKYLFYACAPLLSATGIQSPSGHTASAAAIYGGALVLLARGRVPSMVLPFIPIAFAVVIGISRVAVGAHVPVEAIVGGAIGVAGAAVLAAIAGMRPDMRLWPIVVAGIVVGIACHGFRLHLEATVHHLSFFTWLPLPESCRA